MPRSPLGWELSQFYIELVHKATLSFTLFENLSGNLFCLKDMQFFYADTTIFNITWAVLIKISTVSLNFKNTRSSLYN